MAIYGSNAVNNTVQGNVIGLVAPAAGTGALGNGYSGIYVGAGSGFGISSGTASGVASNTTIGDTTALGANTISANGGYGIWLASGTTGDQIQGNNIGADTTGSVLRDNSLSAIQIDSGSAQSSAGTLVVDGSITGGGAYTVASGEYTVRGQCGQRRALDHPCDLYQQRHPPGCRRSDADDRRSELGQHRNDRCE